MSEEVILSEEEQKFIALDRWYSEMVKPFFDEYTQAKEKLLEKFGVDHYFQDDNGIVYKTIIPEGTFVSFQKAGCNRTKRDGETRGTLSVKEAKEKGFEV